MVGCEGAGWQYRWSRVHSWTRSPGQVRTFRINMAAVRGEQAGQYRWVEVRSWVGVLGAGQTFRMNMVGVRGDRQHWLPKVGSGTRRFQVRASGDSHGRFTRSRGCEAVAHTALPVKAGLGNSRPQWWSKAWVRDAKVL